MLPICVIGAGNWGKHHVKTLDSLACLGGVVEINPGTLAEIRKQYPKAIFFSNFSRPEVFHFSAYTVATPPERHFEITKMLLEHKKHVLVEKPITLSSKEARELVELAKVNRCVLMCGHLLLFHPAFQKIKEWIQLGNLGKVQYLYSNRLNLGTVRTKENSLWSFAPHDISLFQYFLEHKPESISCYGGAFVQPHIHDTTMTILRYQENIVGHIFVSWLHPFKEHRLVVIGTKGMISFEDSAADKKLLFFEKGIDWVYGEPVKREGKIESIPYDPIPPLEAEFRHFIDCIEGKAANTVINGEKGVEVLTILEEASQQLRSPFFPTLDKKPEKQSFFIHPSAMADEGCEIGEGTQIWHFSHILSGSKIGKYCKLGQNVTVGKNVKIGNYVKIQNNVSVYEGVELEDYVFCGPSMVFTNIKVPRSKYPQAESKYYLKTLVKEGASIGANATINPGVTIGKYAFIGSGAVVTKNVEDYAIMAGNPAKRLGWMSEGGKKLTFQDNRAYCEKSGKEYQLKEGKVVEIN